MRIFEIIQPTITQYPYQDSEYSYADLYKSDEQNINTKPHGGYSYADDVNHDPHEITVKNMKSRRLDPKYEFYPISKILWAATHICPRYTISINMFKMNRLETNLKWKD